MDFASLKQEIQTRARIDVGPHLEQFRASDPNGTPERFLARLRRDDVIDVRLFKELHTLGEVDANATMVADTVKDPRSVVPIGKGKGATVLMQAAGNGGGDANATRVDAPDSTLASAAEDRNEHADEDEDDEDVEHYEVLGELGKGAMGEVHLARDLVLRRKVAMKSILPKMQENQAFFSRFLGEMQITAQLDHPFIVPIYGVENGPSGGLAYAMKLVQGRELEELLDETKKLIDAGQPLDAEHSLEARLEIFLKVCDALAYAHERGVIHRDLKPANIMLGKHNEVYVMDWGIARLMGKRGLEQEQGIELYDAEGNDASQATRTRLGSTLGTPIYMSPEQAAGKNEELDGRSDMYSLALILQEMVTLKGAVGGTTLQEVLTNAKDGRRLPPEPPAPNATVPREIGAIIEKATRLDPALRYANVTEFADDIRRYLRNEAISAQPDTLAQSTGRWISKHRMAAAAMILLALLAGAGATIGILIYNSVKLEAKHNRELRLAELQASSSVRAQELDATLQHYEKLLTRMSGAAGLALSDGRADGVELHPSAHFEPGPNAVSGLMESKFYGKHVSFDWPVSARALNADLDAASKDLGSVEALRTMARGIMLESLGPSFKDLTEDARVRVLADTGVPVVRVTLTLESGLHAEYPGAKGLAADHDGRKEPLYQRAKVASDVIWGPPVRGENGDIVLRCATALRDDDGSVVGVLMFQVDPGRAVETAIDTGKTDHVESSLLVERTGRVIAQTAKDDDKKEPEMLGMEEVREAMGKGETGYLETRRKGRDVLVTYQPLSSLDWYLVTVADVKKVESAPVAEGARPGSVAAAPAPTPVTVASAPAKPKPKPKPEPEPEPTASASASASAAPSASAPKLWGTMPTAAVTAPPAPTDPPEEPPPPPPPPNPFDPWKAYEEKKPQ